MTNINLEKEFPLDDDIIYLNHAAVSPWPTRSVNAVKSFAVENSVQGSKNYLRWVKTETLLRNQLSLLINAPSTDDIAIVKNTSEALSMVAFGLNWHSGDNIISFAGEFPSNRVVWQALKPIGVELRQAAISDNTASPEEALFDLVDKQTKLISISSVQYTNGLRIDLERIGNFCQQHNILFCVDAIQSIGALSFDTQKIHADFVMADGHKWMLGPEGVALFYCHEKHRATLKLHQFGWHMTDAYIDFDRQDWSPAATARRFECGSPNMLGIHALSASLSLLLDVGIEAVETANLSNSQFMFEQINNSKNLELLTDSTPGRFSAIATFRHKNIDNEALFSILTEKGVMCAQRGGGIRFSPHFYTPKEKIRYAIEFAESAAQ